MIRKTSLSSCFALGAGLVACASTAAAAGAEAAATATPGNGAAIVLGAALVGIALELRRRVQASMWASREQAFNRRSERTQRQVRSSRAR